MLEFVPHIFGHGAVQLVFDHLGHTLGFVADAFEVGDGLDHGHHQPQVGSGRLAARHDAGAFLVDLHFQRVYAVIVRDDLLGQFRVALYQRPDGAPQLLLHDTAHLQHLVADVFQFLVELLRDVVTQVQVVHVSRPFLSRIGR